MLGVKTLPSASGVEKVAEEIGSRLVERGHEVTVFTRAHLSDGSPRRYRGMHVRPTWSVPSKHLDATTHAVAAAIQVGRRFDVLHVHTTNFAPAVAIARLRGVPIVVQSHGLDWRRAKWGRAASAYLHASDAISWQWAHRFLVVSKVLEQAYAARGGARPVVAPNGVATWTAEPRDLLRGFDLVDRRYILFAARLVPEKGCHTLLEAFARLQNPGVHLVIAGDDLYQSSYSRELKRMTAPNVHFVGAVLGAPYRALVQHADLFVLPSEIEGLSTGLLEAMANGRCIVTSDIPENREAVGEAGITFRTNDVHDLTKQLAFALEDPIRRAAYGERAKRRAAAHFSWDASAQIIEEVYREAVSRRRETGTAPIDETNTLQWSRQSKQ
jgi:glycosyltransferase involved in cell wall biosynthesis